MTHSREGGPPFPFRGHVVKYEHIKIGTWNDVPCEPGRNPGSLPSLCKANGAT